MAQQIRSSGMLQVVDASLGTTLMLLPPYNIVRDRTTNLLVGNVMACTTTATNLPMGGVTSAGFAGLTNLDSNLASATYISIGFDVAATFYEAFRLGPGESLQGPLSPARTWQAKTNSSTADLFYNIAQRNA